MDPMDDKKADSRSKDQMDEKKANSRSKATAGEVATHDCEVCGRAVTGPELLVTLRDIVWMCRSCGLNVGSLPGSLHRVAARFLMGNVL
jgi:hypothetical protein